MGESLLYWIIPIAGIAAILFAAYLARDVMSRDTGTQAMVDVGAIIREGADAFVKRQYTTIGVLALVAAVVIGNVIALVEKAEAYGIAVNCAGHLAFALDRARSGRPLKGLSDMQAIQSAKASTDAAAISEGATRKRSSQDVDRRVAVLLGRQAQPHLGAVVVDGT